MIKSWYKISASVLWYNWYCLSSLYVIRLLRKEITAFLHSCLAHDTEAESLEYSRGQLMFVEWMSFNEFRKAGIFTYLSLQGWNKIKNKKKDTCNRHWVEWSWLWTLKSGRCGLKSIPDLTSDVSTGELSQRSESLAWWGSASNCPHPWPQADGMISTPNDAWNCPDFSTKTPTAQEIPQSQANQKGWSPHREVGQITHWLSKQSTTLQLFSVTPASHSSFFFPEWEKKYPVLPYYLFLPCVCPLLSENTSDTSGHRCVEVFPPPTNSLTPDGYLTVNSILSFCTWR